MRRRHHHSACLLALCLLACARDARAQEPDRASGIARADSTLPFHGESVARPVALFQFGLLFRLDGVPTRPVDPYSTLEAKDSAAAFHGNIGALVPVGEGRWFGPAMVWTVNEVGGFVGLELRHRRSLARGPQRAFPSLDLSAGVLVAGEVEDFATKLPGFTAGVSYNVGRAASFTARFDAYRYEQAGEVRTGSDLYLGILTGSWLVLVSSAAFLIALGSSWD